MRHKILRLNEGHAGITQRHALIFDAFLKTLFVIVLKKYTDYSEQHQGQNLTYTVSKFDRDDFLGVKTLQCL